MPDTTHRRQSTTHNHEEMPTMPPTELLTWHHVFRTGILPGLTTPQLEALAHGLRSDDGALLQGETCSPPPALHLADWPLESACATVYAAWKAGDVALVGDAELWFIQMCHDCDERLNMPGGVRWFLDWFDNTPRPDMIPALLAEVEAELSRRAST